MLLHDLSLYECVGAQAYIILSSNSGLYDSARAQAHMDISSGSAPDAASNTQAQMDIIPDPSLIGQRVYRPRWPILTVLSLNRRSRTPAHIVGRAHYLNSLQFDRFPK